MTTQHIDTLIVGAGQARSGHRLSPHAARSRVLIVDGNGRIGDNWRCHYDSLTLYSPAKFDGLPGMDFPGDPWHFPGKDEVAAFLEQYAVEMELPVRMQTRVDRLVPATAVGSPLTWRPRPGRVRQRRRRHGNLRSHSAGARRRRVALARDPAAPLHGVQEPDPAPARDDRGRRCLALRVRHRLRGGCGPAHDPGGSRPREHPARLALGQGQGGVAGHRLPLEARAHPADADGPQDDGQGPPPRRPRRPGSSRTTSPSVAWNGSRSKVTDVSADGKPVLDDGRVLDVANVIWATGFRPDFGWIEAPITGDDGWPREYRGVVDAVPGLFFCGLSFQFAFSSMVLPGVGRDAAYVAARSTSELPPGRTRPPRRRCADRPGQRTARRRSHGIWKPRCARSDSAAGYPRAAGRGGRDGRHRGSPPGPRPTSDASGWRRTGHSPTWTTAELEAADFAALATTAYLLGRRNDCVQALQRAYQASLTAG